MTLIEVKLQCVNLIRQSFSKLYIISSLLSRQFIFNSSSRSSIAVIEFETDGVGGGGNEKTIIILSDFKRKI